MHELKDALSASQALELILAQVTQRGLARQFVHDQRRRGRRQKYLATVAGAHDPCGTVEGRAEVVALPRRSLTYVKPHPDTKGSGLAPGLVGETMLGLDA